jgi:hypothetical protein
MNIKCVNIDKTPVKKIPTIDNADDINNIMNVFSFQLSTAKEIPACAKLRLNIRYVIQYDDNRKNEVMNIFIVFI